MTYPADPNQPPQYQPDQSAWSQGQQPPNTGGFYQGQPPNTGSFYPPQPGYIDPNAPQGFGGPAGPTPPKSGTSKGLIALIAALAVAVVGLGVGLVLSLNRADTASSGSSTVTVTSTEAGSGGEPGTETVTETVTESAEGPADPTAEPDPAPENVRAEGTIGEPIERTFTNYEDITTGVTVTVHTAEWKDALEGDYVDPPVDSFLVLDITIEATKGTVDYSSSDWDAKDVDGREYSDAFIFGSDLNLLNGGTLAEGEKVRGSIIFDLPRGESTVVYTMDYDDLGVSYKIPA